MTEAIILALIGVGEAVITAVITFKLTKRKYNSEVDSNVISNMEKSLNFYKKLSDDNSKRLDEVLRKNNKLEDEVDELRKSMFSLMSQICTRIMCQDRVVDPAMCPWLSHPHHVVEGNHDSVEGIIEDEVEPNENIEEIEEP